MPYLYHNISLRRYTLLINAIKMKKNKVFSIFVLLLLVFSVVACTNDTDRESVSKNIEQQNLSGKIIENVDSLQPNPVEEVTVVIKGSEKTYEDLIEINAGNTAYDVLVKSTNINKLGVVTKEYDFGKSIDGIGNDLAGNNNKYWIYYINDEMAMQSADNQEVISGDKIEFKFEASTM